MIEMISDSCADHGFAAFSGIAETIKHYKNAIPEISFL
jgi:hypothetical protein